MGFELDILRDFELACLYTVYVLTEKPMILNNYYYLREALLGGSLCPLAEFQTFSHGYFRRFACRCRNFIRSYWSVYVNG